MAIARPGTAEIVGEGTFALPATAVFALSATGDLLVHYAGAASHTHFFAQGHWTSAQNR